MKTIKTIKESSQFWKKVPVGTLLRMRDQDANKTVDRKEARYVPKSEWKILRDAEETKNKKEATNA